MTNKPMKDKYRLMKLQDLYSSYGYTTDGMSEREIGDIAFKRGQEIITLNT